MRRIATAAAIVVAVLAVAGFAFAESQPPDPTLGSAPAAPAAPAAGKAGRAGILKGVVHGDLLVRNSDGTTRTEVRLTASMSLNGSASELPRVWRVQPHPYSRRIVSVRPTYIRTESLSPESVFMRLTPRLSRRGRLGGRGPRRTGRAAPVSFRRWFGSRLA